MRRILGLAVLVGCLQPAQAHAVVGGASVPDGSAPYAVALLARASGDAQDWERAFCGGSLVAPRIVLTAAHCVTHTPATEVLIGRTNLLDRAGRRHRVASIAVHPGFDAATFRNDAALLTLAEPAAPAPVALGAPGQEALWAPGAQATVLGWGTLSERQRSQTAWLQAGALPIAADAACSGMRFDAATQLCAGSPAGDVDACQGDSGGPLAVSAGDRVVQIGIVSSGRGCGRSPGIYTRLGAPALAAWIAQGIAASAEPVTAASRSADGVRAPRAVVRSVRRVARGRVEVRGLVRNAPARARVLVQRRAGAIWVTVARSVHCTATGRFRVIFRAGSARPRVRVLLAR